MSTNMGNQGSEANFEILRESGEGSNPLNRSCVNTATGEPVYYMQVDAETISVRRGDAGGPVIATADSFQGRDGITEIAMVETEAIVPIRHKHHTLPMMHGSSYFRVDGKQMQWKKHKELIDDNGNVLARFEGIAEESHKVGRLEITQEGQQRVDLAVITCLIDQERADEGKYKKPEDAGLQAQERPTGTA